ncbi:MAG: ABC transporter permease [Bacilli bacterium]|nr:ABC transporter permease [Bacillales bacterium]MDY2574543.1 ABC transporter permease [Bacilli bacterium]
MKPNEISVPKEKLVFASSEGRLHDKELVTKPISYFRDAWNRFKKNKASIAAAIVIAILGLYAIIAPIISPYSVSYKDPYYVFTAPKIFGGTRNKSGNEATFLADYAISVETKRDVIVNNKYKSYVTEDAYKKKVKMYDYKIDTYYNVGVVYMNLTVDQYKDIQAYQDANDVQIIYPWTDMNKNKVQYGEIPPQVVTDGNIWYQLKMSNGKPVADVTYDSEGKPIYTDIYAPYSDKDGYTSKMRIEGEGKYQYSYATPVQNGNAYKVRIDYYNYYRYIHADERIDKPFFLFGTTNSGQDIFTCLASGARFSFILAITVASVNMFVGAIYGAIEGYYGGKIDIIMERIVEILNAVPFMIVITLLKYHMEGTSHVLILFIAFFLTGWIGMAGRTRMQFYRFKNQEYVLAARTLGAKDARIMFKHIFPNSLGTLITSSVLVIPSMIFSETSLSYLGIINLNSGSLTSVGTLLANGQPYLVTYPHIILFPSIYICLLMLSFNLFGNGLRDAFNPSLRGAED